MATIHIATDDADEAPIRCGEVYFPHRLTVLHDPARFHMALSAMRVGPISAGLLSYSGEVRLVCGELETGYEVNVPMSGSLLTRTAYGEVCASPHLAAVYNPDSPAMLHGWADGGSLFGLKIDRPALESHLADLVDVPVRTGVRFGSALDLRHAPGRQWWMLARSLVELARDPGGPLSAPMIARPLSESVMTALLYAVDHPYRDQLAEPQRRAAPAAIRRAVQMLEDDPELPWTVADLARRAGLSVRSLQEGFLRHVGPPPMTYLRAVRLRHVHADLRTADPARQTVARLALRWGFGHLGRFAAAYRKRYGETPSATLHRTVHGRPTRIGQRHRAERIDREGPSS
ncbi:AraC family transcriptional regulator [Rhizomonospora bruguierae]|uniref:AraC family transcriptional regulator n=1 Tax=Rhizomonospora bruguierae TaxID=1581705 RepID=UPI001BCA7BD9|nr:AraC family transcriptional regulator [Micromonospora sp. NBRC 107566]